MNPGDDKAWQPIGVPDDFETLQEFAGTERQPLSTPTPVRDLKGMTYCSCADTPNTYSQGKATARSARPPDPVGVYDLQIRSGTGAFLATVDTPISVSIQPQLPVES